MSPSPPSPILRRQHPVFLDPDVGQVLLQFTSQVALCAIRHSPSLTAWKARLGFCAGASHLPRLSEEQVHSATKKTASWVINDPNIRSAAASASFFDGLVN